MRVEKSSINPLAALIDILPEVAKPLLEEDLSRISLMLNAGGIYCSTNSNILDCLRLLEDLQVLELEEINGITYYKKGSIKNETIS